jgi:phosphoglycolate phosphatase
MKHTIILFDLDGTLIDSTVAILESFRAAYAACGGKAPDDDAIKAQIGYPLDTMFATLGVPAEAVPDYVNAYKAHYRTIHRQKTVLLPQAKEAVEMAATFAHLGIVTTKTGHYSRQLLEHLGLMPFFDVLIGREDVVHPKPDPEPIRKALEALPDVTGDIYMVGDTCMDMEAAHAAGIIGMGVVCGYGTAEDLRRCSRNVFSNALEAIQSINPT